MAMMGTWALTLHILSYKHFGILMLLGLRQDSSLVIEWTATSCLHLISPCFVSMQVYSIREAAANNLKRLAEEFGPEWALQHIIPQVMEMIKNPHYLYRMTVLVTISLLAPVVGSEATCQTMLPVVISAAKDRVPNIKFNVAKMLQSMIPVVDSTVVEQTIRPCLVELHEDPDVDVRFFAGQALQACDQVMCT
jgi:serine/threonine-protein phosphatase 2A regulatory subunit A